MHAHINTGCKKEAIICRHTILHGFSQCFIFSWQISNVFLRSVFCFYYSTILTNPPLWPGRGGSGWSVFVHQWRDYEFTKSRGKGICAISLFSFPKYQVVCSEGPECWDRTWSLSISSSYLSPHSHVLALAPNLWMLNQMAKSPKKAREGIFYIHAK